MSLSHASAARHLKVDAAHGWWAVCSVSVTTCCAVTERRADSRRGRHAARSLSAEQTAGAAWQQARCMKHVPAAECHQPMRPKKVSVA